jgi:hypothetical protein
MVDRVFKDFQCIQMQQKQENEQKQEEKNHVVVPYIPGFSDQFKKLLSKEDVTVVFKRGTTLFNQLCRLKPQRSIS